MEQGTPVRSLSGVSSQGFRVPVRGSAATLLGSWFLVLVLVSGPHALSLGRG